jgi:hypothetical protein
VECAEGWAYPRASAARFGNLLAQIEAAPRAADPLSDREDRRPWPGMARHQREKTSPQERDSQARNGR